MVWFHSGDFLVGATHLWDASVFSVKQKVRARSQNGSNSEILSIESDPKAKCFLKVVLSREILSLQYVII